MDLGGFLAADALAGATFNTSWTFCHGTTSYSSVSLSTGINSYPSGILFFISGERVNIIGLVVVVDCTIEALDVVNGVRGCGRSLRFDIIVDKLFWDVSPINCFAG